jgi:hypothetical protein
MRWEVSESPTEVPSVVGLHSRKDGKGGNDGKGGKACGREIGLLLLLLPDFPVLPIFPDLSLPSFPSFPPSNYLPPPLTWESS